VICSLTYNSILDATPRCAMIPDTRCRTTTTTDACCVRERRGRNERDEASERHLCVKKLQRALDAYPSFFVPHRSINRSSSPLARTHAPCCLACLAALHAEQRAPACTDHSLVLWCARRPFGWWLHRSVAAVVVRLRRPRRHSKLAVLRGRACGGHLASLSELPPSLYVEPCAAVARFVVFVIAC